MSRTLHVPLPLPKGVEVAVKEQQLRVKGGGGDLELRLPREIGVRCADGVVSCHLQEDSRRARMLGGTVRALVRNMLIGVSQGFERKLLLDGVGYRVRQEGSKLVLSLGFSHPVEYSLPKGLSVSIEKQTIILLRGVDKQQVGQVAAEIRALRPPDVYKGKGIRYAEEILRRKEGKKK